MMTAWTACSSRQANGTLMAREGYGDVSAAPAQASATSLTWGFGVERAKGIEPS